MYAHGWLDIANNFKAYPPWKHRLVLHLVWLIKGI